MLLLCRLHDGIPAPKSGLSHFRPEQTLDSANPQERVGLLLPKTLPTVKIPEPSGLRQTAGTAGSTAV